MSDTHTSELNGKVFLMYVCTYVYCMGTRTAYMYNMCDNTCTPRHFDSSPFVQNSSVSSCFGACSEHRYSEYFQKSTETIVVQIRKTGCNAGENEREFDM